MANPPFQVKALYEYSSPHEDDLKFPNGQILTVTDEEDNDWYFGEYEDPEGKKQEGLFPKNFVKIFEPETPPRPSRSSRTKKDSDQAPSSLAEDPSSSHGPIPQDVQSLSDPTIGAEAGKDLAGNGVIQPRTLNDEANTASEPTPTSPPVPAASKPLQAATLTDTAPTAPLAGTKLPPPKTAEKPASGSFRDRINAFNKPAAPPVAPAKPSGLNSSGGSGFVKKPFVAPPPSKSAYVPLPQAPPPQKIYRREEDPGLAQQADVPAPEHGNPPDAVASADTDAEEQPKPTSLKDRIALLQKQQMEQAARHAEKKDKGKKHTRKPEEDHSVLDTGDVEEDGLSKIRSDESVEKKSMDSTRDVHPVGPRSGAKARRSSEDEVVGVSPTVSPPRELLSDANDADQSGAGDSEGEELSPGQNDIRSRPKKQGSLPVHERSRKDHNDTLTKEHNTDEEEEEKEVDEEQEEEEIDPEVKRKMELRERMAKMSGGMGMAGMFGPPGGLPSRAPVKSSSGTAKRTASGDSGPASTQPIAQAPPVPMIPMPGLANVKSPDRLEDQITSQETFDRAEAATEVERSTKTSKGDEDGPYDDIPQKIEAPSRTSTDRAPPPPPPHARPVPPAPATSRAPPPVPSERPIPPQTNNSRSLPPAPVPAQVLSPSEGSASDDELSPHAKGLSNEHDLADDSDDPTDPVLTPEALPASIHPSLPGRPKTSAPQPRDSDEKDEDAPPPNLSNAASPKSPADVPKRTSRPPPVPGAFPPSAPASQTRVPPPPPPSASAPMPPSRSSTANSRGPPPPIPKTQTSDDKEEEVTEYEGDYDTDMASSAPHKDALKGHARAPSLEDDSMAEEASLHHSGLPSIGPPPSAPAPRAVPPPPPTQQPRVNRPSSDMPRAAPPPPPPPSKDKAVEEVEDDYDPYKYTASTGYRVPSTGSVQKSGTPRIEEPEEVFSPPPLPPQRNIAPPIVPSQILSGSPSAPATGWKDARPSADIQRTSTSIRRSTDVGRQSTEQGLIAAEVDLGHQSRWWTQPEAPPPIFQNRRDILFETEETSTSRRGGKQTITRTVYVLFMDYSQTIVTAHFESRETTTASLEQHHEGPPRSLRQDQLEEAHAKFGAQIAEGAQATKDTVVGDGTPHSLPYVLISAMPDALLPVGVRAYGAMVYANLANASVQQFDEIRPGDIVTFRNAKFQGHRGPMHSKYAMEVGKPDHVGIVLDWDGTKKKVRAWEQGRESKKNKAESFKFGDLRSGEVKVWRVMPRSWVGWEGQN